MRDITEAVTDPRYPEVIAVQGSQTGKTLGVLIASALRQMHYRHKPCLLFEPTEDLADAISDRLLKGIESVPELAEGLDRRRKTKHEFWIYSVRLGLGWGGSASQTASHPAELILFDELDRLRENSEGNPWQQTKARKSTYALGTHVGASSPTLGMIDDEMHPETGLIHWRYQNEKEKVLSLTWQLWQEGTRGEFMLPCPECHTYFAPKSKLLLATLPEDASPEYALQHAGLACPHCGSHIEQRWQQSMINKGKTLCPGQNIENNLVVGNKPNTRIASFHVNGLCSPWESWGSRAFELVRVMRANDKPRIQVVINTEYGECYGEQGEAPQWESVKQIKEGSGYRMGTLPERVQLLTCGVDVQMNRLVAVVMGWAMIDGQLEAWLIQYEELFGRTAFDEVWNDFADNYLHKDIGLGNQMLVSRIGIDSGFNPSNTGRSAEDNVNRNIIYDFCKDNKLRVVATKGASRQLIYPFRRSLMEENKAGRKLKRGFTLYELDTDYMKREIYARLNWPIDKPGRWHFPENTPDQFFQELTAEQLTEDGRWVKTGENHVLDAVVINYFLALRLKLRERLPNQITSTGNVSSREDGKTPEPKHKKAAPKRTRRVQSEGGEDW